MVKKPVKQSGFSLFELSLVVLVITLMLSGAIKLLYQMHLNYVRDQEQQRLEHAKQALLGYVALNGRLPCPDINGDGKQDSGGFQKSCGVTDVSAGFSLNSASEPYQHRVVVGHLPYLDLGIPRSNLYGHPYQYIVTLHFADYEHESRQNGLFRDPTPYEGASGLSLQGNPPRCPNAPPVSVSAPHVRPTVTGCSKGGVNLAIFKNAQTSLSSAETLFEDQAFAVISVGKNLNDLKGADWVNRKDDLQGSFYNTNTPNERNEDNRYVYLKDLTQPSFDDRVVWASPSEVTHYLYASGLLP